MQTLKGLIGFALVLILAAPVNAADLSTVQTLRDLAETSTSAANNYLNAADSMADPIQKDSFQAFALQRTQFRAELLKKAKELGANPKEQSPVNEEATENGQNQAKSVTSPRHVAELLSAMKTEEEKTIQMYDEAINRKDLESGARELLQAQAAQIKNSYKLLAQIQKEYRKKHN